MRAVPRPHPVGGLRSSAALCLLASLAASCQLTGSAWPAPRPVPRVDRTDRELFRRTPFTSRVGEDLWNAPGAVVHDIGTFLTRKSTWVTLPIAGAAAAGIKSSGVGDGEEYFYANDVYPEDLTGIVGIGGEGWLLLGAGALWYGVAQTTDSSAHAESSKILLRSLTTTGLFTVAIKAVDVSQRPDGHAHGFPSGHSSMTMAAATTLYDLYGPGIGLPAFLATGAVGLQRLDTQRHDLGDVLFGWALGFLAARSVTTDRVPEVFGLDVDLYMDPEFGSVGFSLHN